MSILLKIKTTEQGILITQATKEIQSIIDAYTLLDNQIQELLKSKYPNKTHIVAEGETLRSIAYYYYKDFSIWKALGLYNNIQISTLTSGEEIEIPSKESLV